MPRDNSIPSVRTGQQIPIVRPGNIISRVKANLLIAAANAFLNLKVVPTSRSSGRFIVGDGNAVLELPRGGGDGTELRLETDGQANTVQTLLNLISGPGIQLTADAAGGVTIRAVDAASNISDLTLVEVMFDVLKCRTAGGQIVYVAKSRKLRNSVTNETIEGVQFNYFYDATYVARTSQSVPTSATELQVVVPPFLPNDIIKGRVITSTPLVAIPGTLPTIVDATYEDTNNDGRAWARRTGT